MQYIRTIYFYLFVSIIIFLNPNIFADDGKPTLEGGIFDSGVVTHHSGKKYKDIYVPEQYAGEIVTKVFTNNLSGRKLYYEGADGWGMGTYYVIKNGKKQEICGKNNRWEPSVCWYGGDIVEMWIGSNSSWSIFQYYDYTSETYEEWDYRNPLCIDIKNSYIIWNERLSIFVTDIKNQKRINEYTLNEYITNQDRVWIENKKLIVSNDNKQFVFDYPY